MKRISNAQMFFESWLHACRCNTLHITTSPLSRSQPIFVREIPYEQRILKIWFHKSLQSIHHDGPSCPVNACDKEVKLGNALTPKSRIPASSNRTRHCSVGTASSLYDSMLLCLKGLLDAGIRLFGVRVFPSLTSLSQAFTGQEGPSWWMLWRDLWNQIFKILCS
jgi:hypothetical protein